MATLLFSHLQESLVKKGLFVTLKITRGYNDAGIVFVHPAGWFEGSSLDKVPCTITISQWEAAAPNNNKGTTLYPVYICAPATQEELGVEAGRVPCTEAEYDIRPEDERTLLESGRMKFHFGAPVVSFAVDEILGRMTHKE